MRLSHKLLVPHDLLPVLGTISPDWANNSPGAIENTIKRVVLYHYQYRAEIGPELVWGLGFWVSGLGLGLGLVGCDLVDDRRRSV